VEVKTVGAGSDPCKNRKRMGDEVPVMGPGMLPAFGPRGRPTPAQQVGWVGSGAPVGRERCR